MRFALWEQEGIRKLNHDLQRIQGRHSIEAAVWKAPRVYPKIYLLVSEHVLGVGVGGSGTFRRLLQEQKCWWMSFLFSSPNLCRQIFVGGANKNTVHLSC